MNKKFTDFQLNQLMTLLDLDFLHNGRIYDELIAELYVYEAPQFLNKLRSMYKTKNNLFAYMHTSSPYKQLVEKDGFITFSMDMTPTAYKFIDNRFGKYKLVYNDQEDYHVELMAELNSKSIDANVKRVTDSKVPVGRQTNQQFSLLFCNLSTELPDYVEHIQCYFKYMVKQGGEFMFITNGNYIHKNIYGNNENYLLRLLYDWGDLYNVDRISGSFTGFIHYLIEHKRLITSNLKIAKINNSEDLFVVWLKKGKNY